MPLRRPATEDIHLSIVEEPPVDYNSSEESIHKEMCSLVCRWLSDNNYSSTLQVFRDEINAHGKEDHSIRKAGRSIAKAVEDGNWDSAYAACKKLEGNSVVMDVPIIALLLAKQHFLELVDEGDAQRAFTFFLRRIKPSEEMIGKMAFQQLTYLLTCRSVADAAAMYPELRGWTPSESRASLVSWISSRLDETLSQTYAHDHRLGYCEVTSLDLLIRQALSYQLIEAVQPEVAHRPFKLKATSILKPLHLQSPPIKRIFSTDIGDSIRTCQPFLHIPAVAVGTAAGEVLWCTLQSEQNVKKESIASHAGRVWSSSGTRTLLVTGGGRSMIVYSIVSKQVLHELVLNSEPLVVTIARDGSLAACGTSEGDVVTALTGVSESGTGVALSSSSTSAGASTSASGGRSTHRFKNIPCTSLAISNSATTLYAGFKDGVVRIIDLASSVVTRILMPPVVAEVTSLALSPTAMFMVVAYKNNTLRVWNVVTGALETKRYGGLTNQSKSFVRATFGNLDQHLLSGSEDGSLCFWLRGESSRSSSAVSSASQQSTPVSGIVTQLPNSLCAPTTKIPLHSSMITDVKICDRLLVTCSEDGELCICGQESMTKFELAVTEGTSPSLNSD